jgi:hypothetical protein
MLRRAGVNRIGVSSGGIRDGVVSRVAKLRLRDQILDSLELKAMSAVLDVGCGRV